MSRPPVKNFETLKRIHDSGDRHLEKSKYRHISAMGGPIAMKFGPLMLCDPLDHSVFRKSAQVDALFDLFMRMMSRVHFQKKYSLYRKTREST